MFQSFYKILLKVKTGMIIRKSETGIAEVKIVSVKMRTLFAKTKTLFDKTRTLFAKTRILFDKTRTLFAKTGILFDKTRTLFAKTGILFDKTRTLFNKTRTLFTETRTLFDKTRNCWLGLTNIFPDIELDEFIVMPNHFHGIIFIYGTDDKFNELENIAVATNNAKAKNDAGQPLWLPAFKDIWNTIGYRATIKVAPTVGKKF